MALNYTPAPIQQQGNPLLGRIGASIGNFASGLYNGVKNIASNPATFGTQNQVQYNNNGFTSFTPKPTTQNYTPVPTPANPAATGTNTVNTATSSPAAQQYIQSQVKPAPTVQAGLYSGATGLTANGLNPSQVAQGYSTVQGGFDPLTGKPIGGSSTSSPTQGTQPYTPQPTGSQNSNIQQIDPNTGLPLTPNSNNQTDQAYLNYLQAIQPNQNVISSEQALNDFTAKANQNINQIGAQPILGSFATGQQQVAGQNANLEEQRLQGNVSIAQQAQQQAINAGQAGLNYSQGQQALAQARYLGTLPTPTAFGQTSFNPATGQFSGGSGGLDNATLQQYAQMAANGQYAAIPSSITSNIALNAQLNAAAQKINPSYNPITSAAQGAAAAQNATTTGTVDTSTAATGYTQAIQQYQQMNTASQAATQQAQSVSNILSQSGINSSSSRDWNTALNNLAGRLGNTNVTALNTAVTELQSRYSSLLAGNGQTPSSAIAQALGLLNPNSTAAQITQSINVLQNAADILTSTQYQQAQTYHNQLTGGGSTSSSGSIFNF